MTLWSLLIMRAAGLSIQELLWDRYRAEYLDTSGTFIHSLVVLAIKPVLKYN